MSISPEILMRSLMFLAALVAALPPYCPAQPGKVTDVTLYRGQARVTREVQLPARTGAQEIVVSGMPKSIVPDSLFAEADAGTDVRAVRYRTRAVGEQPREEVRAIDAKIRDRKDALEANQSSSATVQKRLAYLDKIEGFVAPTAHGDLSKGALDAEALERLVLFSFKQRKEAQEELLKLTREARDIQSAISLLERQRSELHASSSRIEREAVVFVEKRVGGAATIRLNYLVVGCGWTPTYNIRARDADGVVQIEYNAVIQQTTGEDWGDVDFTLSTATPALSASGPGLAPFAVSLQTSGGKPKTVGKTQLAATYKHLAKQQRDAQVRLQNAVKLADNFSSAWDVNRFANDVQTIEIVTGNELLTTVAATGLATPEGPSLSYHLEVPVSLASRSDQQMVRIARSDMRASFYHVATPVLTTLVYREAEMVNTSGFDMLMGPVSVYVGSTFVGRAEMANVSQGETFVVGLGADARLRAGRKIANKIDRIQGGNRVVEMSVRLQLENFHDGALDVRVYDRLPHTDQKGALRVTQGKMSHELSADTLYVRTDLELGILRWDVSVPATSTQEKALFVEYAYALEFDRNLQITSPGGRLQERFREEFQQLMRRRGR